MKSDVYNNDVLRLIGIPISVFLLMEIPVRLWLQPDPWLLSARHWYFDQPLRLLTEFTLVLLLLATLKCTYAGLLTVPRAQRRLLLVSMLASVVLFGSLEADQLRNSLNTGGWFWLAWFFTGFCIGVGQELLYRGLLFSSLHRFMSTSVAGLLTTIAFVVAPLHSVRLWDYIQNDHFAVFAVLVAIYAGVSVFFQWLRNVSGSALVPAMVHGVGNAVTWVAVFA